MGNDVISKNLYSKKRCNLNMSDGTATFSPNPSLISEGATHVGSVPLNPSHLRYCDCADATYVDILDNSCQHLSCNLKSATQSHNDNFNSKRTYLLTSYRLKNKFSSRFTFHPSLKPKAAFTLAEVLITLGVIGVVAVLTLSVVIPEIQNRQNIARWKKAYSTISNAYNLVISEDIPVCRNGSIKSSDPIDDGKCISVVGSSNKYGDQYFNFSEEFVDRFREILAPVAECYQQIEPKCDNYGYENQKVKFYWSGMGAGGGGSIYGTLKKKYNGVDRPVSTYNIINMAFLLKDGCVVYLGDLHGGPWISVDVNGAANGPNQIGRDFFQISVRDKKILPLGAEGTYDKSVNGEKCECSKDFGAETMLYFAGAGGHGEIVSGGCCSAKYLIE